MHLEYKWGQIFQSSSSSESEFASFKLPLPLLLLSLVVRLDYYNAEELDAPVVKIDDDDCIWLLLRL